MGPDEPERVLCPAGGAGDQPVDRRRRRRLALADPGSEVPGGHGPGVVVALGVAAAELGEPVPRFEVLDPFGDDPVPHYSGQLDGRTDYRLVPPVRAEVLDERAVDFDHTYRQHLDPGQRRIAGAEIVYRYPHADVRQASQDPLRALEVQHHRRLGDLQGDVRRDHVRVHEEAVEAVDDARVEQAAGRDVDRHGHLVAGVAPGALLLHGGAQDPPGEWFDEAGLLGDGDELVGGDHAQLGVRPAQQRLEAGDPPRPHLGDRLVPQLELLLDDRPLQVAGEHQAAGRVVVDLGVVDGYVAAGRLGGVHGDVGPLEQRRHVRPVE